MVTILERAGITTGNSYSYSNVNEYVFPFVKSYEDEWVVESPASPYPGKLKDMLADYSIPFDIVWLQVYSIVSVYFFLYMCVYSASESLLNVPVPTFAGASACSTASSSL